MTRFETTTGTKLGARFAGDNGATFHLTSQEANDLFNLHPDTPVTSDNAWRGSAEELQDMFLEGHKATAEEMQRRWTRGKEDTLHFTARTLVDTKGNMQTFFKR